MKKTPFLTDEEIRKLRTWISAATPGLYRLRDLAKRHWGSISIPKDFGIRCKRMVLAGLLPELKLGPKTAENHQTYIVAG